MIYLFYGTRELSNWFKKINLVGNGNSITTWAYLEKKIYINSVCKFGVHNGVSVEFEY